MKKLIVKYKAEIELSEERKPGVEKMINDERIMLMIKNSFDRFFFCYPGLKVEQVSEIKAGIVEDER